MRPKTNQSPRDPLNYMKKAPHHLSNMMGEISITDKKTTTANTRAGASTQMVSLQNANLDSVLMFNNLNFMKKDIILSNMQFPLEEIMAKLNFLRTDQVNMKQLL